MANTKKLTNSIRVNTGAKWIEVNDDGEKICLNFGDQDFPRRFFQMMEEFDAYIESIKGRAEELDEREWPNEREQAKARAELNAEIHVQLRDRIDDVFGADTCRKVFGPIIPSVDLYAEFLEAITPYFAEYAKEREATLKKKYSATRKGNV